VLLINIGTGFVTVFPFRKEVLSKLLQLRANEKYEIVLDGVTCIYLRCIQTNRTSIGLFPMANFYAALVKRLRKENRNEVSDQRDYQAVPVC
jgi:hypothetical protein